MYLLLFNAITDALALLEQRQWENAAALLRRAQIRSEAIYLDGDED